MSGPDNTAPPDGCTVDDFCAADLDGDEDVDLGDFSELQNEFTGTQ